MTTRLINCFDTIDNIKVSYKDYNDNEFPCIVDITHCRNINDMLEAIENFRNYNYHNNDVDIITSVNTENMVQLMNDKHTYCPGQFDYYNGNKNILYNNNLHINGELIVQHNITAFSDFYSISDSNLKYDIHTIKDSLKDVEKLRPVSFNWKHNNEYDVGFIANEIEEIYPNLIKEMNYKVIKESKLIPYLVDSIKILKNRINEIKKCQ